MGLITLGLFAVNDLGLDGAVLQSVNHALISATMFLLVGMVERRCGTGELDALGGMARGRPVLATVLLVAGMIALAVPGSTTFAGEFLIMAGVYNEGWGYAAIVALGIVLAAMYVLRLISAVLHVRPGSAVRDEALDLRPGELALVVPLVACLLALSAWPALVSQSSFPANRAEITLKTDFSTEALGNARLAARLTNELGLEGPCRDWIETALARAPDAVLTQVTTEGQGGFHVYTTSNDRCVPRDWR
jgi:NADH:ubiquinone oxidoreductase subunit 4 (subunit M)